MKKLLIIGLLLTSTTMFGCGSTSTTTTSSNSDVETSESKNEKVYLNAGDVYTATDERGTYEFKVTEAKFLGVHDGDNQQNLRLQVTWEINNISFAGKSTDESGNELKDVVAVYPQDLKVKDDNNYVLDNMNSGWEGDWINSYKPVKVGEKMIQKYTWILNDENAEYVTVSYPRMQEENIEFKINIDR